VNRATAQHGYLHHYPKCGKKSAETINTKFSIVQLLVEGFVRHKRQHFHCNWQQGFWWIIGGVWIASGVLGRNAISTTPRQVRSACRDQAATVVSRAPKPQSRDFQLPACAVSRIS